MTHADDATPPTGDPFTEIYAHHERQREQPEQEHARQMGYINAKHEAREIFYRELVRRVADGEIGYDHFPLWFYARADNGGSELSREQQRALGEMADRGEIIVRADGTVTLAGGQHG